MKHSHRNTLVFLLILCTLSCRCYAEEKALNLNDIIAAVNNNNNNINNNQNTNNQQNGANGAISTTSVKTQEFTDLPSLIAAMNKGNGGDNTANLDLSSLVQNKEAQQIKDQNPQQQQQQQQQQESAANSKEANNNSNNNNDNNNKIGLNLANLAALLAAKQGQANSGPEVNNKEIKVEAPPANVDSKNGASIGPTESEQASNGKVGQPGLSIETDGDNSRSGHSHFTLKRDPEGGLMLVPVKEETGASRGLEMAELAKKAGSDISGTNRQQLQLTSLAQALYSPFPSDQNTLHLHLKGKDGKNGKVGPKGHPGAPGPLGPAGPKGPKGEQGTCAKEVLHQPYTCTPDEIESLSSRVDYLEKICKKVVPVSKIKPTGEKGGEGNPMPNCQAIYEKNPNAKSGAYWLMVNGIRFKTWCEFIKKGGTDEANRPALDGGWTLVARIKGQNTDWSPLSKNWASNDTLNGDTAHDIHSTTSMKNIGYTSLKSNVLLLCFTGPRTGCAPFTHGLNMPLAKLFSTRFGVVPDQQYTFATFMKSVGKSCDLSILRQSWCGLNLANVCDPKNGDPNEDPPKTTHIARIGCIGDRTATCFPDDYAIGIGVTSCKDGFGCSNVGHSKNMHYRCDYVYGAFSQTAYLYVL